VPVYNVFDVTTRHILPQFFHHVVEHESSVSRTVKEKVSRGKSHNRTTGVADHLNNEPPLADRRISLGSNHIL